MQKNCMRMSHFTFQKTLMRQLCHIVASLHQSVARRKRYIPQLNIYLAISLALTDLYYVVNIAINDIM